MIYKSDFSEQSGPEQDVSEALRCSLVFKIKLCISSCSGQSGLSRFCLLKPSNPNIFMRARLLRAVLTELVV